MKSKSIISRLLIILLWLFIFSCNPTADEEEIVPEVPEEETVDNTSNTTQGSENSQNQGNTTTQASTQEASRMSVEFQNDVLKSVNALRAEGCTCGNEVMPPAGPLTWNDKLENAAKKHTEDMNDNNFFDHKGSDGSRSWERIKAAGYNWKNTGENIGKGQRDWQTIFNDWVESPGHCKNIMSAPVDEIAVYFIDYNNGQKYWTMLVAAER